MQTQLKVGNDVGFECFVDDLVIQILCRVPAEQLWWRCRLVCKRWNALISSPSFAHAHLQHSPPTFFVFYKLIDKWQQILDFFLPHDDYDDDGDKAPLFFKRAFNGSLVKHWKRLTGVWVRAVIPVASCNGLVLLKPCMYSRAKVEFYIGNLITGELLTMKHPHMGGYFCGFFYHSSRQEYKLVHCHRTDSTKNTFECEYTMLTLGSTEWRSLGTLPYGFQFGSSPVIVDDTLYWMADDMNFNNPYTTCENWITMLSIHSEEFHTMSHPSIECEPSECHWRLRLLAMDSRLTCWYFSGLVFHAWVYEVPSKWTRIYRVDFNRNFGRCVNSPSDCAPSYYNVRAVRIRNQKLTLLWSRIGVFRYDLLKNTVEKIELEGIKQFYYDEEEPEVACFTKSLISLSNFYPGLSEVVTR